MKTRFLTHDLQGKSHSPHSSFSRVIARLSSENLKKNYAAIQEQVPGQAVLPMLKADGYGHGAEWVARQLLSCPHLYGFGVATLEEGACLRGVLGGVFRKTQGSRSLRSGKIIVFSGTTPWTEEKGWFCEHYGLTAVIATDADWDIFSKSRWPERIAYELKFNTGMNRLGLSVGRMSSIQKILRNQPRWTHPSGVCTHLAQAENPQSKLSQLQKERFIFLRKELFQIVPTAQFHFANSAAIWNHREWGLSEWTDVIRPGLSLYGVVPWKGAPKRGIFPVMSVQANVIAVHHLRPGERVGYGGEFRVSGNRAIPVAVLSAGYADGIHRILGGRGKMWLHGQEVELLGRISMDLLTIRCPEKTRRGEWAELLGSNLDIWKLSEAAMTIPYELLTSISSRVQRVYE